MKMSISSNLLVWRGITGIFFLSLGAATVEIGRALQNLGVLFSFFSFWWVIVISGSVIVVLGLVLIWTEGFQHLVSKFIGFYQNHHLSNRKLSWGLFLALTIGFSAWVIWGGYIVLNGYFVRIFFCAWHC
jgi:hypothetical protein